MLVSVWLKLDQGTYMIFISLGSSLGAGHHVSRLVDTAQDGDTYAWRMRKVVCLS